ncbi:MAG: bifunctional UDP-3-O-[3-hydroxymyristoyl] N-acetylglucosamine deacetylase/3-hydroxyacyl-ACP dehydratase [Candidatus Tritonobacter lacicola]|nr:bifunctional UDP-3-O-[3-hydroxymyristoyl] N-acetylglucosamine deacetylase/3-hydroxyacyl-ACP dehydratase [Candidatus Tritonobacter lacicola]
MERQRTIAGEARYFGIGVHTGSKTAITFKPAPPDTGIRFVRVDLPGRPSIAADIEHVVGVERGTVLGVDDVRVHTVEHVLAALCGLGIDNLFVEVDANEPPVGDGSAVPFVRMIRSAGIVEQDAPRAFIELSAPVRTEKNGATITVIPGGEFRISCTYSFPSEGFHDQFLSLTIDEETFEREIAPCRTFCFYHEVEELMNRGLIKGGSLDSAVVIGDGAIFSKERLRFRDEFVRHKILDLLGDLYLLGMRIRGHVIAVRSGHELNVRLVNQLAGLRKKTRAKGEIKLPEGSKVDINDIKKILPHRYPFLLVDRIVEMKKYTRIVGIKNVTVNEPFFMGHFPERPVMPGVLIIEAMAQTAGVLTLQRPDTKGKLAYFMAIDRAKFRRAVVPGDQLRIEIEVLRFGTRVGKVKGTATVDGEVAAQAELTFAFIQAGSL